MEQLHFIFDDIFYTIKLNNYYAVLVDFSLTLHVGYVDSTL